MSGTRQNIQGELAFPAAPRREAPKRAGEGTEPPTATRPPERPANTDQVMEEGVERANLKAALHRVKANKGSPGIDGRTVQQLPGYLAAHWPALREQWLQGTYQPQPVKRVEIEKPGGGVRQLGVPTVLDRFLQQAVLQVLQRDWDRTFSPHSDGFRPHRSAQQAVAQAQQYVADGCGWVVALDLEKFFDRVNHDKLRGHVAKRITDQRMLRLLRAFLTAGVLADGLVRPTEEGTPQGGPLSPLLSNLGLDTLDRELERRGHRFVRYADDCNIYVRSQRAGQRVMASITRFITTTLKLKVNGAKSAVAPPGERTFLGVSFTRTPEPRRRLAPSTVTRCKARVRDLTRRTRGVSLETMVQQLGTYLRGWHGYFGFCQTPSVLTHLDAWIRRRLRSAAWKRWKQGRTRFTELRRRGVGLALATTTAGSAHGPWRLSHSRALDLALPKAFFVTLGLPELAAGR
jgi:RNA-directed DNA polymerase